MKMSIDVRRFFYSFLYSFILVIILGLSFTVYRYYEYTRTLKSALLKISEENPDKVAVTIAETESAIINIPILIGILTLCLFVINIILYYLPRKNKK
jgi:hypothetical protein